MRRNFWATVKIGDKIRFFSDENCCDVVVVSLNEYDTFEDAWEELGDHLIPDCTSKKEAHDLYSDYFSDDDVQEFKVVAVGIKIEK